jgi:hypothetical protein
VQRAFVTAEISTQSTTEYWYYWVASPPKMSPPLDGCCPYEIANCCAASIIASLD